MLARLDCLLIILLGSVSTGLSFTDSNNNVCDFEENIVVGRKYPIFSPNYPSANYGPNTACRWTARSDRPIMMKCTDVQLPYSPGCAVDLLLIRTSNGAGERYCGTQLITLLSASNEITIELYSSPVSPGGRFLCTLEAVNMTNSNTCRCGWKHLKRIEEGEDTGVNEYTMMAGLVDPVLKMVYCGATILNPRQVVTAAHCVSGKIKEEIAVLVGDHDLRVGSDTQAPQLFKTHKIIPYPGYNNQTDEHDIALVEIDGFINFNLQVGPACLPIQHWADSFAGSFVDILGWGTVGAGEKRSNVLQKAHVSVITNDLCSRTYRGITPEKLCTLGRNSDSCQHDSGGPVLWTNPSTKRLILTSLISSGGICADGNPAINTRVGAYSNWIMTNTPSTPTVFLYCAHE